MTPTGYLTILREQWKVLAAAIIVALSAAVSVYMVRPPEYTANLTMYVSAQSIDTAQAAYQGGQLSAQRVTSYVQLVGSPRITDQVAVDLGLEESGDAIARQISATSSADSVLINISVTDTSSERAAAIANRVGILMTDLVAELERPTTPDAITPVEIRVVQPAAIPNEPSSIGLPATIVLGALAGIAVGVGAAFLRNSLDKSVRGPENLQQITGQPNLGAIAFDAGASRRPLIVQEDPQSPRAEAYRQLRTNLQFADIDRRAKVILLTSSVASEGKTTTSTNLAIALAATGARVIVVEADLRRPAVSSLIGVDRSIGLTSLLTGRVSPEQAIQQWAGTFDLLASGQLPPNPSELLGSKQMTKLLNDLRNRYDYVLVDTPPLLPVTDASALAPATDGVLLLVRSGTTSQKEVQQAVGILQATHATVLGSVMTMVPLTGPRSYSYYRADYRSVDAQLGNEESARKSFRR